MSSTAKTSHALLLFGLTMASSWVFTRFRGELGLTDILFSRLHFALFWGASLLSTWWGSGLSRTPIRWGARAAALAAAASALIPWSHLLEDPAEASPRNASQGMRLQAMSKRIDQYLDGND